MDLDKLIALASKLGNPNLVTTGTGIAADIVAYAAEVKANADRAAHILTAGDRVELDAIHAEALASVDRLDAALASAERR